MKFGFVILNYMVIEDVYEAYTSIVNNLPDSTDYHIYVVDNGSSEEIKAALSDKFSNAINTDLLLLNDNLGFAKGNNEGIRNALRDKCDFIVCMNNDVVIDNSDQFIKYIRSAYDHDNNIAVIGTDVITKNGIHQNPYREKGHNASDKAWFVKTYSTHFGWMKYWLQMYWIPLFTQVFFRSNHKNSSISPCDDTGPSRYVYALHGSVLVFTPAFFQHFNGFDAETFLYGEEVILAEKISQQSLKCWYCAETKVFHKEDVSTDASLKGISKKRFFLKHQYDSYKHLSNRYFRNRA